VKNLSGNRSLHPSNSWKIYQQRISAPITGHLGRESGEKGGREKDRHEKIKMKVMKNGG